MEGNRAGVWSLDRVVLRAAWPGPYLSPVQSRVGQGRQSVEGPLTEALPLC